MKKFRTLELAIDFYDKAEQLSLVGHFKDQLMRASSSIALNLAEGNAKISVKEKKRFYQMSYASLKECQTIFQLIKNTDKNVEQAADQLGAHIYKLLKSDIKTI